MEYFVKKMLLWRGSNKRKGGEIPRLRRDVQYCFYYAASILRIFSGSFTGLVASSSAAKSSTLILRRRLVSARVRIEASS